MNRTIFIAVILLATSCLRAEVCNLKVVTDASPDYSDLPSMVRSITSNWHTPEEKCWAVFYWNHIARRQTNPINLHGMALTDPIRQFNDYGYTMCSTISGINQSIWEQMGLKHRYWDISLHTVAEVFYDDHWHMYDNSLSALYTLCDGKTLAGVEDIGKEGACEASGGKKELGHIAKYHCLTATSPRGFLIGADTARSLDEESHCFNPKGLKLRTYFYDWDHGHRYILNMRAGESYTRNYAGQSESPEYFIPNDNGKDPEKTNARYRIRGNGRWEYKPAKLIEALQSSKNIVEAAPGGIAPAKAGEPAEAVFKVQSANVITSQTINATFERKTNDDKVGIAISADNGLHWKEILTGETTGEIKAKLSRIEEVNGAYEVLIKVTLQARANPADAVLRSLEVQTITAINSKTQPKLNLGKNTVYVGAGDQTESIVFWPELQGGKYKQHIVEEKNIKCVDKHIEYQGAIYPAVAKEDAYIIYRIDAPNDLTKVTYGGRFYNRAPKSHIELYHSFDNETWTKSYSLTDTNQPWDVIHYEMVDAPKGKRSVWLKYVMNTTDPSPAGCSIYAIRIAADHLTDAAFLPMDVTFTWAEPQKDRTLVERSHCQLIDKLPTTYTVNVGGEDQPIVKSLQIAAAQPAGRVKVMYGYSDGKDARGEKFAGKWVTYGKNLAVGKSYTCSHKSENNWGAGDPEGKTLTDGVAGPSYAGGTSYKSGAIWKANTNPVITLDLGAPAKCASFGMNFHGFPFWDALKGQIKDKVEVLTSDDGQTFTSAGFLNTDLRWKDLPANHMWTDEETMMGGTFRLIPEMPVTTRYVQYKVTSQRFFDATELEVLDSIEYKPFDLKIALPKTTD